MGGPWAALSSVFAWLPSYQATLGWVDASSGLLATGNCDAVAVHWPLRRWLTNWRNCRFERGFFFFFLPPYEELLAAGSEGSSRCALWLPCLPSLLRLLWVEVFLWEGVKPPLLAEQRHRVIWRVRRRLPPTAGASLVMTDWDGRLAIVWHSSAKQPETSPVVPNTWVHPKGTCFLSA